MNMTHRQSQIAFFLAGAAISTLSGILFVLTSQHLAGTSPSWLRALARLISGMPWIMVAVMIGIWRFKGPQIRILAYLFGTIVPIVLLVIGLAIHRQL